MGIFPPVEAPPALLERTGGVGVIPRFNAKNAVLLADKAPDPAPVGFLLQSQSKNLLPDYRPRGVDSRTPTRAPRRRDLARRRTDADVARTRTWQTAAHVAALDR